MSMHIPKYRKAEPILPTHIISEHEFRTYFQQEIDKQVIKLLIIDSENYRITEDIK
jgi:hypothetical protein